MNTKNLLRLALAAALLLVAAAPRAARADCTDGVLDGDELGIDCGGSCAPCTCGTDLTRLADPPRLINSNTDLTGDAVETGLAGDDLRVAFTLDAKVFTTATTEGGNTFAAPEIEFVDKAGGTNEAMPGCTFLEGAYTITPPAADPYTGDGSSCAAATTLYADIDFTTALRECGFLLDPATYTNPATGETYSQYVGQVRVRTEERGDTIRGVVLKKLVEVGFEIVVQFPDRVQVSSDVVDIIGEVVEDAALTHQVWNLDQRHVDLNMFTSVQYPYTLVATDFELVLDSAGSNPPNSAAGYPTGLPDSDGVAGPSLLDFFNARTASTPADGAADFGTPQVLPPVQCASSSTGSVNADACNQNFHLRLVPDALWCDVDFDLQLTLQVACRPDVFDVACSTDDLPEGGRNVTIRFGIDSDNYCPRIVEVAELTGELGMYEDDEWGAHAAAGGAGPATQYPGHYPDAPRDATGSNLGERWTQDAFVFGTELHLETRVVAEAGVNLASSTIDRVWVASSTVSDPTAPGAGEWSRMVYEHSGSSTGGPGLRNSGETCNDFRGLAAPVTCPVTVSNDLTVNDMTGALVSVAALNSGAPDGPGSFGARLGRNWEGVSRFTLGVGTHTFNVPAGQDFAEPVKIFVDLVVTYAAAGDQEELSVRRTMVSSLQRRLDFAAKRPAARALTGGEEPEHPPTAPALAQQSEIAEAQITAGPDASGPAPGADGANGSGDDSGSAETETSDSGLAAAATGTVGLAAIGAACVALVAAAVVVTRRRRLAKADAAPCKATPKADAAAVEDVSVAV